MAFPTFTGIIIIHVAHLAKELHAHEPVIGAKAQTSEYAFDEDSSLQDGYEHNYKRNVP